MKNAFLVIVIFLIIFPLYGQTKPRLAVMPFDGNKVSEEDADTLTSLFETELVNTNSFIVIEQSKVNSILKAQKYSLSGYANEEYAADLGKLLSAEQIVLGKVSEIGNSYLLNTKIVDVEEGRNIRADSIKASTIDEFVEKTKLLAYKLAGLTIKNEKGDEKVASSFGELIVETNIENANVFLNGVKKGTTPIFMDRVPVGRVTIKAEKGQFQTVKKIEIEEGKTKELFLNLEKSVGKIFIKPKNSQIEKEKIVVMVDGNTIGTLESSYFKDIPTGNHDLIIVQGNDEAGYSLFYRKEVNIVEGETLEIEPILFKIGTLIIQKPRDSIVEVSGPQNFKQLIVEKEKEYFAIAPIGSYTIRAWGEKYNDYENSLTINYGDKKELEVKLEYTDLYKNELKLEKLMKERQSIKQELDRLHVEKDKIERENRKRKRFTIGSFIGSGVTAIGSGIMLYLGHQKYKEYEKATITEDAVDLREQYTLFDIIGYIAGGVSVLSGGTGTYLSITKKDTSDIDNEIESLSMKLPPLEKQISKLKMEM